MKEIETGKNEMLMKWELLRKKSNRQYMVIKRREKEQKTEKKQSVLVGKNQFDIAMKICTHL